VAKEIKLTREEQHSIEISYPCLDCIHLLKLGKQRDDTKPESLTGWTCKAFPHGIPAEILKREFNHSKKHWGQVGDYVFTSPVYEFEAGKAVMTFDGRFIKVE